jgi:hypothetical protein
MTKLYSPGDNGRAICPHCEKLVSTTFVYRDVPFDDGTGQVKGILTAVCDVCDNVAAVPAQSTPAIRRARDIAEIPLEVSLPAPVVDILDAAAFQIDQQSTPRFRKAIFTYYLSRLERDPKEIEIAQRALKNWAVQSRKQRMSLSKVKIPNRRLSFKLAPRTEKKIETILGKTGWNKTSLVRGVAMLVERDILSNKSPKRFQELQDIAAAVNA